MIVENCASLPITQIGILPPIPNIHSLDVLVVPYLTKNLISISKLIILSLLHLLIIFSLSVATSKRDGWPYVLERVNSTLISILQSKFLRTSYDL